MPNSSFVIILIFLHYFTNNPAKCSSNDTDALALLSFKNELIDQRGALNSWTINPTQLNYYCSWKGITCGVKHPSRVVSIDLDSQGLVGPLSPHLGNLSFLRRINLQNNSFHGSIPQQLGLLRRLVYIVMSNNSFSGEIPRNISQCRDLRELNLIDNELTGIIPPELASLSKLTGLGLSHNSLSGTIPPFLGNFTSLRQLALANCGLRGEIPNSLGRLKILENLVLYANELTGTVPSGLFNISTMRHFLTYSNKLQGTIPSDIGLTLPNLRFLGFGDNNFTGALPVSLSNASFLQVIELYSNRFTGPMPTNLGRLTDLEYLSIYYTSVQDDIGFISSLTNCTNLFALQIGGNSLTGSLPVSIANLSTQLTGLSIGTNQIHGTIPSGIGNLFGLQMLDLQRNLLSGPIPETIGKLTKLRQIGLDANAFIDELPSSIGNLTALSHLYARSNFFSRRIPPSLVNCSSLLALDLSVNSFDGPIPREIMSLSSLSISLNLSHNALSGSVPSEIGSLKNLAALDLSNNMLSGIFPITISSCVNLQWLYLENNSFYGEIPQGLSSLSGLQELNLSTNNFSGLIPSFLGRTDLKGLSLSSNRLEGPVPIDGIFRNKSAISLQGNAGLCGGVQELDLPPCPSKANPRKKISSSIVFKVLIPIAFSVAISMIALVACCYILVRRRKNSSYNLNASSLDQSQFMRLSYADLIRATGGFSEANLIGSGRFSNVYKGILDDGETLIAVKVLKLDVRGAHKSFVSECSALRGARHRNVLKILSISLSTDFQRNDFMALIYSLKPNGSLDKWLHSDQRYITLMQRISIAIDIASAVEYLHNGTGSVIVHGDLKPSNVLLDDDMTAHVGDFGLAKVISNVSRADESSSIAVKGTIGYIAPEYGMGGAISTQGDVYSYGILLLEMLTNIGPTSERLSHSNLRDYVTNGLSDGLIEILDPLIVVKEGERLNSGVVECVVCVFETGMACSREVARDRISVTDAIIQLKRISVAFNAQGWN